MRIPILAFAVALLAISPAIAAPTCLNLKGETVRCDASDAMPVGWTPSEAQLADWQRTRPPNASAAEIFEVILAIAAFLGMIALLPEFDGTQTSDWDRDDDSKR